VGDALPRQGARDRPSSQFRCCSCRSSVWSGRGHNAKAHEKTRYEAGWEDTPEYLQAEVIPVISRLVSLDVPMAITPGNRCMWLYPSPADVGCFWQPAGATHGPWGFATFTPILYYGKDWRAGKGPLATSRPLTELAEKNGHPCPKPLRAWSWLLDKVCPPGAVVLDPFVGSGTTLRAAKNRGRKAIGIEIEERFCEIAVERLGQEVLPLGLDV
jgi:hypothetical protein